MPYIRLVNLESHTEIFHAVALFSARMICGILFTVQGYDKLFILGVNRVTEPFEPAFRQKNIPRNILSAAILISSIIEFGGGVMLMAGIFRDYAAALLLMNLIGVAAGFSLVKPVWDMQHFFPRLALLLLILLLPPAWDAWRLDALL